MSPVVVNILDLIDMGGREVLELKLATFSSPKNPEIEDFIRNKAISFATGKLSITYLVNDENTGISLAILLSPTSLSSSTEITCLRHQRKSWQDTPEWMHPLVITWLPHSFLLSSVKITPLPKKIVLTDLN